MRNLIRKQQLTKIILIFLGVIILSIFLWFRFIRERLPKDIPFQLNEIGVIFLVYICIIYIYLVISLLLELKITPGKLATTIIDILYKPLKTLDDSIKTMAKIKPYYKKFLLYLTQRIKYITGDTCLRFCIVIEIVPRIVLLSALLVDIFYFHCLYYIYKVILITLFILLGKYILYSFKYAKEQYIIRLEYMVTGILTNYRDPEDDPMFLTQRSVRDFIEIQTDSIFYDQHESTCHPLTSTSYESDFCKAYKLPENHILNDKQRDFMDIEFYTIMPSVISLSVFIEEYTIITQKYSRYKYIKIIIFSTYLLCWTYILFKSLPTLPIDSFRYIPIFNPMENPFSGIIDILIYEDYYHLIKHQEDIKEIEETLLKDEID